MKILKLSFQNINSLKGTFQIDFQEPPLGDSGLFIITGPTGSGKTSVLDAICAALYGKTPRLPNTKELEQLMTHGSGECRSEVLFSVKGKRYRSHYERCRARKKPDGKFQPPKMELADDETGKIIADKLSETPLAVEALTGLDYARFSRSIMLAQGDFRAFLEASEDQRASLLEKMTGTEIYTDISKLAHQREKDEKETFQRMRSVLDSVNLLTGEIVEENREKQRRAKTRIRKINQALEEKEAEKKFLEDVSRNAKTAAERDADLKALDDEIQRLAPDFKRLEKSVKTLPLKVPHAHLAERRRRLAHLAEKISEAQKKMPGLTAKHQRAVENRQAKSLEFEAFQIEEERVEGRVAKTLSLDALIKKETDLVKRQSEKQAEIKRKQRLSQTEKNRLENSVAGIKKQISHSQDYLSRHAHDKTIATDLPLIREKAAQLHQMEQKKTATEKKIKKCDAEADAARQIAQKTMEESRRSKERLKTKNQERKERVEGLNFVLQGKNVDFFQGKKDRLEKEREQIEKILEKKSQIANCAEENRRLRETSGALEKKRFESSASKAALSAEKKGMERRMATLEEAKGLEDAIKSLADRRQDLTPDAPCPLCGSKDHPWAAHAPRTGDTETRIKTCATQLRAIEKKRRKIDEAIAGIATKKEMIQKSREQQETLAARLNAERQRLIETPESGLFLEKWDDPAEALEEIKRDLKQTADTAKKIKQTHNAISKLKDEIIAQTESHSNSRIKYENARRRAEVLNQERGRLKKERQSNADARNAQISDLDAIFRPHFRDENEETTDPAQIDATMNSLTARLDRFIHQEQNREKSRLAIIPIEERLAAVNSALNKETQRFQEEGDHLKSIEKSLMELKDQRHALFGDKDPIDEQARVKQRRLDFQTGLKKMDATLAETKQRIAVLRETMAQQAIELKKTGEEKEAAARLFNQKLGSLGWSDEADFLASTIDEMEQKELEIKQKAFEKRKTETESLRNDCLKKQAARLENPVTEKSMDSVMEEKKGLEKEKEYLISETGAIQSRLKENEKRILNHQAKVDEANHQEKEWRRWSALSRLAGSHDGAKFRKFAQGLTLETLITKANDHLAMLTRRYELKRSDASDLGIEVIDTFHGDQIRPTGNLSGGESFLASLALALGLSDLSGRRAAIESLFLDEGFGTLDAETLEIALSALDALNASGKTIGVISHIEALKERISAKIEITPSGGGVSSLTVI